MFTGIVSTAHVRNIIPVQDGMQLVVDAPDHFGSCKPGDSVAIDGACLTVSHLSDGYLHFYVSPESISKTIIDQYQIGTIVNIELSLRPQDRMGGHYVLGHVDCVSRVLGVRKLENCWFISIVIPEPFGRFLVYKGSITVNGTSLTVNSVDQTAMELCIIPVTLEKTNLRLLEQNTQVNLEFDILAKYTEKLLLSR